MRSIREQVYDAQSCSDVYGIKEKIAYQYHLRDSSMSAKANWSMAERDLERWSLFHIGRSEFEKPVESFVHELLQKSAHRYYQYRGSLRGAGSLTFNDWMYAQNRLAEQIMHQVNDF